MTFTPWGRDILWGMDRTSWASDDPGLPNMPPGTVIMQPGKIGGDVGGGVIANVDIGAAGREDVYMEYTFTLPADFEWTLGGKLPGLQSKSATASTSAPSNGHNGWSWRPMWGPKGQINMYCWDADAPSRADAKIGALGQPRVAFSQDGILKAGATHKVQMGLKLNTPGVRDGIARMWVDGKLIHSWTDTYLREVNTADMKIHGCFFAIFYGGSDRSTYAPTRVQRIHVSRPIASDSYIED